MSVVAGSTRHRVREQRGDWQHATTYLLDVNVLIALLDPLHAGHKRAHAWFAQNAKAWASCAITQNGYVRIVSQATYTNPTASPAEALEVLADLCKRPEHQFWSGDLSLLDDVCIHSARILTSRQITDTWLLALAVKHGGKLATFDKHLVADAVVGGRKALHLIA